MINNIIPNNWTNSRVVFIPKPGKFAYTSPKDFRPLSLTSFLLKGLEKIILWYIEENFLSSNLHDNLFAYRQKKSTETALHAVVHKLETSLLKKECSILVCLDIDSAFSMATPHSMVNELKKTGCETIICNWIWALLTNRNITAKWGGYTTTKPVNRGAPQGGILSPVLFNIVMNSVFELSKYKRHLEYFVYADDIALIVKGEDYRSAVRITNFELHRLSNWAAGHSLTFSPPKTKALLFYRKIPPLELPLYLNREKIEWETEVKYLGVIIDNKLKWKSHLDYIYKKSLATTFQTSKMVGATWGTSPKVTNMIYNCIVKPAMLYGAVVWVKCLRKKNYLKKLQKIQAQACRLILGVQRSTPIAAMEVILNLRPIEIEAETKALLTAGRLERNNDWKLNDNHKVNSTARYIEEKINTDFPHLEIPTVQGKRTFCQTFFNYKIDQEARTKVIEVTPEDPNQVHVYTDGSKDETGRTGYGYTIKTRDRTLQGEKHFNLGTMPTVFQAEVMAIHAAADWLHEKGTYGKIIDFYIDNQAAIFALKKSIMYDRLALETKCKLNILCEDNTVKLNWIPAHSGYRGNEIADRKAKLGCTTTTLLCEPAIPVMDDFFKNETAKTCKEIHNRKWKLTTPLYRQSKLFFHELRPRETRWLLQQGREKVHDLTGLITGHNSLNYHQYHLRNAESPNCRFCNHWRETASHLLTGCPAIIGSLQSEVGICPFRPCDLEEISLKVISKIWDLIQRKLEQFS